MIRNFHWAVLAMAGALVNQTTPADETGDAARAILETHSQSVVTVRLIVKERWIWDGSEGNPSEYAVETTGFVIADDGAIVTSLSATDPEFLYAQWFDDDDGFKVKTEVTSLTLIYDDGSERNASVVLRDRDLDLIFIRPDDGGDSPRPIPAGATGPIRPFDSVIRLERFDHTLRRVCGGEIVRVEATVDKPRRLFAAGGSQSSLGTPVFALDGTLLGMTTMRQLQKSASGERGWRSDLDDITIVVVAAEDLAEAAKQIPPRR